jgi:F-type H+-transporting ATPase subunit gamma
MKLVSSSKLRSVEEALFRGRTFGQSILNAIAMDPPKDDGKKKDEDSLLGMFADTTKRHLCLVLTTDKGLCGAVNSSLARAMRKELAAAAKAKANVRVITLGDKGRAQIARDYVPLMARSYDQLFDKDPNFALAAAVAAKIVQEPYDVLTLFYNHYENQAKFISTFKQIPQMVRIV